MVLYLISEVYNSSSWPLINVCRPGVVKAVEEFKRSVYGDCYDEENNDTGDDKVTEASKKRKALAENAVKACANFNWDDLAENGKVKLMLLLIFHSLMQSCYQFE